MFLKLIIHLFEWNFSLWYQWGIIYVASYCCWNLRWSFKESQFNSRKKFWLVNTFLNVSFMFTLEYLIFLSSCLNYDNLHLIGVIHKIKGITWSEINSSCICPLLIKKANKWLNMQIVKTLILFRGTVLCAEKNKKKSNISFYHVKKFNVSIQSLLVLQFVMKLVVDQRRTFRQPITRPW